MSNFVISYNIITNNRLDGKNSKEVAENLEKKLAKMNGQKALSNMWFCSYDGHTKDLLRDLKSSLNIEEDSIVAAKLKSRPGTWRANLGSKIWLDNNF